MAIDKSGFNTRLTMMKYDEVGDVSRHVSSGRKRLKTQKSVKQAYLNLKRKMHDLQEHGSRGDWHEICMRKFREKYDIDDNGDPC